MPSAVSSSPATPAPTAIPGALAVAQSPAAQLFSEVRQKAQYSTTGCGWNILLQDDWSWHRNPAAAIRSGGTNKQTPVWKYFVYNKAENLSRCIIGDCTYSLKGPHTSTLACHLKKHPLEYAEFQKLKVEYTRERHGGQLPPSPSSSASGASATSCPSVPPLRQQKIKRNLNPMYKLYYLVFVPSSMLTTYPKQSLRLLTRYINHFYVSSFKLIILKRFYYRSASLPLKRVFRQKCLGNRHALVLHYLFSRIFQMESFSQRVLSCFTQFLETNVEVDNLKKAVYALIFAFVTRPDALQALNKATANGRNGHMEHPILNQGGAVDLPLTEPFPVLVEAVLKIRPAIESICIEGRMLCVFREEQWSVLQSILRGISNAAALFQEHANASMGAECATIDGVVPSIKQLLLSLEKDTIGLGSLSSELKDIVVSNLASIMDISAEDFDGIYIQATSLNPQLAVLLNEDQIAYARRAIEQQTNFLLFLFMEIYYNKHMNDFFKSMVHNIRYATGSQRQPYHPTLTKFLVEHRLRLCCPHSQYDPLEIPSKLHYCFGTDALESVLPSQNWLWSYWRFLLLLSHRNLVTDAVLFLTIQSSSSCLHLTNLCQIHLSSMY
uniref:Dimer_Tnp_hAT domain-containing protein n=1 Tax=Heterorhabditis bacteriophora TaxID=37862 RepID=A0A1I7XSH6_HETBA